MSGGASGAAWCSALRIVQVTDGRGDVARIARLAAAAVDAGVRTVQLREPLLTARELAALCEQLRPRLDAVGGLLLVNDRADVAAAGLAHGVHLGRRSLRPEQVRAFAPAARIGCSAHDAAELAAARAGGADYAFLSPVHATRSKPGAVPLGPARAAELTRAAGLPVVWLGGLDAERVARSAGGPACGFAVLGALADEATVVRVAAALVAAARAAEVSR
ncbi:MAG: thiamine phosphate synthase [Planctomycetes bacterium]|nr:thiamine phosphate synthase [Planctomycetota bacterium]